MRIVKPNTLPFLKRTLLFTSVASVLSPALAQTEESPEKENTALIEKIEVTARKRSESLQSIPVAVTALTGDDIDKRGVIQLQDLAEQTPGFVVSDNFSGKTDRTVQTFTLRGFSPSSGVDPTTSLFIDGVPVSSTTAISSVGSPARIEILRGPQSAYFGRNTFAGAVNVVNREPNEEWSGWVEGTLGNYNNQRYRGEVEGVVIEDKLSFRLSGEHYDKEGAWDNAGESGGRLGDQRTTMANIYVLARPIEDLTIKLFGFLSEDNDGPAASAFISAYDINNIAGNVVVQGQSNCLIYDNPYFCSVPQKADPLSYNTQASAEIKALLATTDNRLTPTSMLDDYGMAREFAHGHIVADWELGNYTLSSLTGVNKEEWILMNDIDHYSADFFSYPFLVERREEDFSQEFRLSFDAGGAFSGTGGVSYLDASKFNTQTTLLIVIPDSVTPGGESNAETAGVFFGLNYALNEQLSASLEGRYQRDTITSFNSAGSELASESFNNFLPRFIVDYKFDKDTMAYVSFSKGVNPSAFNTGLLTLSDYGREQAEAAGITLAVKPEKVNNYELGLKGTIMGGSMTYALAAYYAEWLDQINRNNLVYIEPGGETATSFSGVSNTGSVDLYGLEVESNWAVTSNIRVNMAGAYTGSEINSFTNAALTALSGITDFSGKEQPNVSKYSGNMGVQYDGELSDALYYFMRADYVFKSGQWVNQANFLKTEAIQKVNLRAGITIDNIDIQVFVNNAFEDTDYTSSYDYFAFQYDFAYFGINSGLVMGLPEPRTFGIQAKWSFY